MGRRILVSAEPRRIVSLVPSQTELLYDLGLGDRVVGVTRYCVHPERARDDATVVGGTKRFQIDRIDGLEPDLIIGNKEENARDRIEALAERYPVWMSDIETLEDALAMIREIGALTATADRAERLAAEIEAGFDDLLPITGVSVAYLIWKKPWMAVGRRTFIDAMLTRLGFDNVFGDRERYPECSVEQLRELAPDVVMLSSEPFPFEREHVRELSAVLPKAKVVRIDGEMFSWYGTRLSRSPAYFRRLVSELAA